MESAASDDHRLVNNAVAAGDKKNQMNDTTGTSTIKSYNKTLKSPTKANYATPRNVDENCEKKFESCEPRPLQEDEGHIDPEEEEEVEVEEGCRRLARMDLEFVPPLGQRSHSFPDKGTYGGLRHCESENHHRNRRRNNHRDDEDYKEEELDSRERRHHNRRGHGSSGTGGSHSSNDDTESSRSY